jgi:hypothetical protein
MKSYLCPSDSSHTAGISPPTGWAVTSYSNSSLMFNSGPVTDPATGAANSPAKYLISNIPDGNSNTIGIVERYGHFPTYNWSALWAHPSSSHNWGWNQWAHTYGPWGLNLPQVGVTPNNAHPYHPNSAHTGGIQVLLMDGSVRGVSASVSQATWNAVMTPDGQEANINW